MSIYTRADLVFRNGNPVGASLDVARNTRTSPQAAAVGQSFRRGSGGSFAAAQPAPPAPAVSVYGGAGVGMTGSRPTSGTPYTVADQQNAGIPSLEARQERGAPVLEALAWPFEQVSNYYNARARFLTRAQDTNNAGGELLALAYNIPGLGMLDPAFRDEFATADDAEASLAQTAWLSVEGSIDMTDYAETYGMLDDEARIYERAEYFGSGHRFWITGTADFAANIWLDPVGLAAGAASNGAQFAARIKPQDVQAAAANAALRVTGDQQRLTGGARRVEAMVEAVVTTSETIRRTEAAGGYAALTQTHALAQTADAGAVASFLRQVDSIADDAERMTLKRDAVYAGMGNRDAMARLEARDAELALELKEITGPNRIVAAAIVATDPNLSHVQKLQAVDNDAFYSKVISLQDDRIRAIMAREEAIVAEQSSIDRVLAVGGRAPGARVADMADGGVGEIRNLSASLWDRNGRDALRLNRTINAGSLPGSRLPQIHILAGRKLPQTWSLSADDAPINFNAALDKASTILDDAGKEELRGLADEFALAYGAPDPGASRIQRRAIVDRFNRTMENHVVQQIAGRKSAESQEAIRAAVREIRTRRNAEMAHVVERSFRANATDTLATHVDESGAVIVWDGKVVAREFGQDGVMRWDNEQVANTMATPFATSQLEDIVSVVDWSSLLHQMKTKFPNGRVDGFMRRTADGAWELTEAGLTALMDAWRFGALLRLGYPVRNQIDTHFRMNTVMGPLTWLLSGKQGLGNMLHNLGRVSRLEAEWATRRVAARTRAENIEDALKHGQGDREALTAEWNALQDIIDKPRPTRPYLRKRVEEIRAELAGMTKAERRADKERVAALRRELAESVEALETKGGGSTMKRGTEFAQYRGKVNMLADDTSIRDDVYASVGDFLRERGNVSAQQSVLEMLTSSARSTLRREESVGTFTQQVLGSNPLWMDNYLRMVNQHIRNDHALMSMLAGLPDDAIRNWYKTDPEGRVIWDGLKERYNGSLDALIQTQREQVDILLPTPELRSLAAGGDISKEVAERAFPVKSKRPPLPAQMKDAADVNPVAQFYNKGRRFWFKWAAEVPETVMGRHPFYTERLKGHLLDHLDNYDKDALTQRQYQELLNRSRILARRDVSNYLFDTSNAQNISHHARFLIGFYSAWWDTMRKWSRISVEHAWVAPLIPKTFMAPNAAGAVVDDEGNMIDRKGRVIAPDGTIIRTTTDFTEGNIIFSVPWLSDRVAQATGGSGRLIVSKETLNVVFQGDPFFLPGAGPLVSISVNEALKKAFPELAPYSETQPLKWMLGGFGMDAANPVEQIMPMKDRYLWSLIQQDTENDPRFSQVYAQLFAEEMNAQRLGESEERSLVETQNLVANRARNWFILRTFGAHAPFSTRLEPRLQFYFDEYRRFRREYGAEADDRFLEAYPDYYEATISLSENETGLSPTVDGWDKTLQYEDEIAAHPDYGWMFVGADNLAPGFNEGVYTSQRVRGYRDTKTPAEAFNDLQVQQGWRSYMSAMGSVNMVLEQRKQAGGSASLSANSNADLKEIRDTFVANLRDENRQWADEFDKGANGSRAMEFMRTAMQAVEDNPELEERSDFQALGSYLRMRGVVQQVLAQAGVQSINAQAVEGVKEAWDAYVATLVQGDIGFEQMYIRGQLERDDLSGTFSLDEFTALNAVRNGG